jgi:ATP synthase F1 epsilon subunit
VSEAPFQVELVSPAKPLFRGPALSVVAEIHDGEMGIQRSHSPVVALLGTGVIRIHVDASGQNDEGFAVRGGFLQVSGSNITLLVTDALRGADVDVAAVKKEKIEVLEALRHPASDEQYKDLLDQRRWCDARLKVAVGVVGSSHHR